MRFFFDRNFSIRIARMINHYEGGTFGGVFCPVGV
jgi:hypothetical protein